MDDNEWQELSRELLGDAAEAEPPEATNSQEQLLMPGSGVAMDVDDWDRLVNELLAGPTDISASGTSRGNSFGSDVWPDVSVDGGHGQEDEGSLPADDSNLDDALQSSTEPRRKRGRPPGTFGSRSLNQMLGRQALQQAEDIPAGPRPGTTAYARK